MNQDLGQFLPLSPATLHILLCLAGDARHGYAIMQEVARQSNGQFKLGPGTLYDNLARLMNQGMVEEGRPPSSDDNARRRYYRLTAFGRRLLAADIERLRGVVREAAVRLRAPHPNGA
jgi:DNA-binding PadR family transcriptional regulator